MMVMIMVGEGKKMMRESYDNIHDGNGNGNEQENMDKHKSDDEDEE